mmetsp:Transcript_23722/g.51833  ORF Transcript_23722/g.51833 Transcript_23722/m.51833 type:complete len:203 (-) Transcript_23722:88-696(-)|eukprot:CAMPEP_0206608926 /NCGR_PEP_ID=MMETSP0325_2-20121206/53390_1 /ASSEMBLY_ACC=CAM_ASM_000347 /TAXON_ID=2866 /ORGANISM="Crypthecodinium cohnii, Strain Seligo" /LENGTH=202 /DNA_ID=CAMNT_0054126931 /DNA_START=3 /DNA_END=611 /DNA_ORIENTATION=+
MATIPYDAKYTKDGVIALTKAVMQHWKQDKNAVPGLDVAKLFKTVEEMYEDLGKLNEYTEVDRDFLTLLVTLASSGWFSKEQIEKLDEWTEDVETAEDKEWVKKFEEASTINAVIEGLGARSATYTHDQVGNAIEIEYEGGNYGKGKHDGSVRISIEGVRIYDSRHPGEYMESQEELPSTPDDLIWVLQSHHWEWGWEEEDH